MLWTPPKYEAQLSDLFPRNSHDGKGTVVIIALLRPNYIFFEEGKEISSLTFNTKWEKQGHEEPKGYKTLYKNAAFSSDSIFSLYRILNEWSESSGLLEIGEER